MSKVLLIDADSTIPNLALMKLSAYHKALGDDVELVELHLPGHPRMWNPIYNVPGGYDKYYCSIIYKQNGGLPPVYGNEIVFGGTGYSLKINLPDEIENLSPDYTIYPENVTSYGFITRGCIRHCPFCVVPEKEGYIHQVSTVDKIVKHKRVKFLDNNILAFPGHKAVLQELIDKDIRCQFNQGLDIRLVDEENSLLLSKLKYIGEYIFAFDDWSYKSLVGKGINYLSWAKPFELKFYVYCTKRMELSNIVKRIEWLKEHECLPYVMRDYDCYNTENSEFYIDLAAYSNQPHIFKSMDFREFLRRRHKSMSRIESSTKLYYNNV